METRVIDQSWEGLDRTSVVALGFFDGFHIGHQAILKKTLKQAAELDAMPIVLTFDCHPWKVLFPDREPEILMSQSDKIAYLEELGFEKLLLLSVTRDFLGMEAKAFFAWLVDSLKPLALISGPNYSFGAKQSGNSELLSEWGSDAGIGVTIVDGVEFDGSIVSSTRIRNLLKAGEVRATADLLGRYFHLNGEVVYGDGRGKSLGFPTANLLPELQNILLPENGVYGVMVRIHDKWKPGVASVGTNPTFPGVRARRLEVHLLDMDEDLYGQTIRVAFCHYLRSELVFSNKEELILQMEKDVTAARSILKEDFFVDQLPNWA